MKNVLTGVIVSAMMTIGLTGTAMAQEDDEATRRADAQQRLEEAAREIAEISGAMAMDQVVKIVERFRITDGGAVDAVQLVSSHVRPSDLNGVATNARKNLRSRYMKMWMS